MINNRNLEWLDKRIKSLRSFDGSLLGYVGSSRNAEKRKDAFPSEVLNLDSNENFFVGKDDLTSILMEVVKDIDLRNYEPESIFELKDGLGRYARVPSECITMSSGSEQLIDLIVRLFLEKSDEVISITPSFFMYKKRVELEGARFVEVPLNADLSLNLDAILEKVTPRTKIIFICSPNNPTGNEFRPDEIKALARESSAVIAIDEAYAEFGDFTAASLATEEKNVIVVRTLSKAFGLAGIRFGYSVSDQELATVLSEIIPYTISSVVARFVLKLLDRIDLIKGSIDMVRTERQRLIENLRTIRGIKVLDSKANFVTFRPDKEANIVHQELLKRGISIKNLGNMPVIGPCLRVTVGLPDMNERFLDALTQILG